MTEHSVLTAKPAEVRQLVDLRVLRGPGAFPGMFKAQNLACLKLNSSNLPTLCHRIHGTFSRLQSMWSANKS